MPSIKRDKRHIIPFLVLFLILVPILPRSARFNYDYKKGTTWKYPTLISQFDFPVYKTKEEMQKEKEGSHNAVPYYRYSNEIADNAVRQAENMALGDFSYIQPSIVSIVRSIYSVGVVTDEGVKSDRTSSELSDDVLYVQKDKRASRYPVSEIYRQSDAFARLSSELRAKYPSVNVDSILAAAGIQELITANLVYDKQTTELIYSESEYYVSPTKGYVSTGQLIVSEGEIITAEIEQMLDSYKREYEANMGYSGSVLLLWLGSLVIALSLVVALYFAIFFSSRSLIFRRRAEVVYLLMIFLLATVGAIALGRSESQYIYLVPFTLSALYMQAFFRTKVISPVYIVTLIPLLLYADNGIVLFVMYLVSGFVTMHLFQYFSKGWKQFISATISFILVASVYLGFRAAGLINDDLSKAIYFLLIGSYLSVAGYPAIYLFEKMFNLVSSTRLIELCDTSNPLIRELETKAPGTFQHSMQLMGMAEAAARSVGANVPLVRAGALYHDIGKMLNPMCFVENVTSLGVENAPQYHKDLSPKESAHDIIKHVQDGLDLADKHRLPIPIKDIIRSHHGTSRMNYFYNQYVNNGGDPDDIEPFTYTGLTPLTKEQMILMICDSVEAAARTLKENTPKAYSDLIERIVKNKMDEGQMVSAEISISELGVVKETVKQYLVQLYHERVVYPKRKK